MTSLRVVRGANPRYRNPRYRIGFNASKRNELSILLDVNQRTAGYSESLAPRYLVTRFNERAVSPISHSGTEMHHSL